MPFPSATHNVGCAGLVIDGQGDEQKFLAIREQWGSYKGLKLPGGSADLGERLSDVAKREVFEETGVRATPVGVLCFRHMQGFKFGIRYVQAVAGEVLSALTALPNTCPLQ